jgi:predicted DNA binding CopG/RHH family protein
MNNRCNETLNIRISLDILNGMRNIAKEKGITYSQLIRDILKDYIEKNKGE